MLRGEIRCGYDAEGRLLQHREAQQGKPGHRLRYDLADNLLGAQSASRALEEQPPPLSDNRLTHWQQLFYRYDAWGNLTRRRNGLYEQHYVYDADNRLTAAYGHGPQGEFRAQYHYDALGRRTRKQVSYKGKAAQSTRFLWQGYRLLQEQREDGTRRSWSYEPDSPWTPLAAIEQAGDSRQADIFWLHSDQNGAPLEVTDAGGQLCWSGNYDTFGKLQGQTAAGIMQRRGAVYEQPLRYAGQYQDNESGLHYNLFRYYEPEVGRFTTQDPIGLQGGLNLYQYAPNPYGWVDPLGLTACSIKAGRNRRMAMNKAKDTAGIPRSQQHESHWQVGNDRKKQGYSNYVYSENPAEHGSFYQYRNSEGHKVVVVEHTSDPRNKIGDAHFHAGRAKTSPHTYDFKTERYGKVLADSSGDHHIYYDYD